jgi:hypothetical protein
LWHDAGLIKKRGMIIPLRLSRLGDTKVAGGTGANPYNLVCILPKNDVLLIFPPLSS